MTFKATTAALTVLLMLAGALHTGVANATHAAALAVQHRPLVSYSVDLGITEPSAARGGLHGTRLLGGVMDAAKQAGRNARSHVPEPKALLLLGLALLAFGLRRGNKPVRQQPPNSSREQPVNPPASRL